MQVLDFEPGFRPAESSAAISIDPPRAGTSSYAVRRAAEGLVAQRLLLRGDADALIAKAEKDGVRTGP